VMVFEQAWAIVKADSGMTSGTPGTNNPRHGPDSPGEPGNFERIKRRSKQKKERNRLMQQRGDPTTNRPSGYGKGGILDPNREKKPPKRVKEESETIDADALLAENKRIVGKSASNLLFALGLLQK